MKLLKDTTQIRLKNEQIKKNTIANKKVSPKNSFVF